MSEPLSPLSAYYGACTDNTTVPDLTGPRVRPLNPPLQLWDEARSWAAAAAAAAAVGVRAVMSGGGAVECGCGPGGKQ